MQIRPRCRAIFSVGASDQRYLSFWPNYGKTVERNRYYIDSLYELSNALSNGTITDITQRPVAQKITCSQRCGPVPNYLRPCLTRDVQQSQGENATRRCPYGMRQLPNNIATRRMIALRCLRNYATTTRGLLFAVRSAGAAATNACTAAACCYIIHIGADSTELTLAA